MKKQWYLILALALTVVSCSKDDSDAEPAGNQQKLIGSWTGTFSQPGYPDFTGSFTISKLQTGAQAATGKYSNPACDVMWTYQSSQNDQIFTFKESIVQTNDCAPGTVKLTFQDDNHLKYDWTGDDDVNNFASGILTRK